MTSKSQGAIVLKTKENQQSELESVTIWDILNEALKFKV